MKIGKLNVILEITSSLNERQYCNVLTIIKEGYEEELKELKKQYAENIKTAKKAYGHDNSLYKRQKNLWIKLYKFKKDRLKFKFLPSYMKARTLRYGKHLIKKAGENKKSLAIVGGSLIAAGGLAAYNSKKRKDEAKKKLGIK